jgi:ABC-type transport system involved in multi-copper enzyme maturation permease subunit
VARSTRPFSRGAGHIDWSVAVHSSGTAFFAAEVFLLVLGATALSGEATAGTLKMILPHGYRRSDWILAKSAVLVVAALLLVLVASAVSLGHAALSDGLGAVTKEQEPLFGEEKGAVEVFQSGSVMAERMAETIGATLAALVATALLGVLLSCLFDGVVASLCAGFLLYGILKYADILLQLPRETLQHIYAWYPARLRELTASLGRGLNERWDDALFPSATLLSLLASLLALLLAVPLFSRRDLK